MERYRVVRIEEQMYGCEELPEGAEVCCDVTAEQRRGRHRALGRHGPAQSLNLEKSWKRRGTS